MQRGVCGGDGFEEKGWRRGCWRSEGGSGPAAQLEVQELRCGAGLGVCCNTVQRLSGGGTGLKRELREAGPSWVVVWDGMNGGVGGGEGVCTMHGAPAPSNRRCRRGVGWIVARPNIPRQRLAINERNRDGCNAEQQTGKRRPRQRTGGRMWSGPAQNPAWCLWLDAGLSWSEVMGGEGDRR